MDGGGDGDGGGIGRGTRPPIGRRQRLWDLLVAVGLEEKGQGGRGGLGGGGGEGWVGPGEALGAAWGWRGGQGASCFEGGSSREQGLEAAAAHAAHGAVHVSEGAHRGHGWGRQGVGKGTRQGQGPWSLRGGWVGGEDGCL